MNQNMNKHEKLIKIFKAIKNKLLFKVNKIKNREVSPLI